MIQHVTHISVKIDGSKVGLKNNLPIYPYNRETVKF